MRILVPVDGSQNSKEILEVASDIAKSIKAEVNLMTLIPGIEYMDLDYSARQGPLGLRESSRSGGTRPNIHELEAHSVAMQRKFEDIGAVPRHFRSRSSLSPTGSQRVSLEKKLTAQAEKGGFDITVIGTRGLGAKAHFFLEDWLRAAVVATVTCWW